MKKLKKWLSFLGPGFITGASDDDPAGIATYSQTGALFGFNQTWTALFSFPLMAAIQEMCGRIGLVTGKGIAGVMKGYYPKWVLYVCVSLLLIANTINIGADLGAMAASLELVLGFPYILGICIISVISLALQVFVSYKVYSQYLKYLAFVLLSYIAAALFLSVDWLVVMRSTFLPYISFQKEYVMNIVALLGTTISPYLFFWQASEEVEEEVAHHRIYNMGAGQPRITPKDISRLRLDTIVGMFFSNLIMFFIIVTAGATLFPQGITNIRSASEAALALRPIGGEYAFWLFAIGIIGTGFLALPILAGSASYALSEAFGWKEGLYKKLVQAPGFYGIICVATGVGFLMNFLGINPISMLYYSAVINGIIAPPLLVVIMLVANNKIIMKNETNGVLANSLGILTISIMSTAAFLLLINILR